MPKRLAVILLIVFAAGVISLTSGVSRESTKASVVDEPGGVAATPTGTAPQPHGFVDGSLNPELVPDEVAYSLLFRLLSNRRTKEEKNRALSYLNMAFECPDCGGPKTSGADARKEADIKAFLAVVKEFEQRVSVLDRRAAGIWRPHAGPEELAQLNELQRQKDAAVADLIASLPRRLGAGGAERLRRHVNERVKHKVKIVAPHSHN